MKRAANHESRRPQRRAAAEARDRAVAGELQFSRNWYSKSSSHKTADSTTITAARAAASAADEEAQAHILATVGVAVDAAHILFSMSSPLPKGFTQQIYFCPETDFSPPVKPRISKGGAMSAGQ